jgi:hypothetical protein
MQEMPSLPPVRSALRPSTGFGCRGTSSSSHSRVAINVDSEEQHIRIPANQLRGAIGSLMEQCTRPRSKMISTTAYRLSSFGKDIGITDYSTFVSLRKRTSGFVDRSVSTISRWTKPSQRQPVGNTFTTVCPEICYSNAVKSPRMSSITKGHFSHFGGALKDYLNCLLKHQHIAESTVVLSFVPRGGPPSSAPRSRCPGGRPGSARTGVPGLIIAWFEW